MNKVVKLKIAPLNTPSKHDKPVIVTEDFARKMCFDVIGTPLMYSNDNEGLPKYHEDEEGNRDILGTAVGATVITDENGIQYLTGYYELDEENNKDILEKLNYFKEGFDDISASFEISSVDRNKNTGELINGKYKGTSIMDIDHSAFQHHALMVATKNERNDAMEITYDEVITKIIGEHYNVELSKRDNTINDLNKQLEDAKTQYNEQYNVDLSTYKSQIEILNEEIARLRTLNENII